MQSAQDDIVGLAFFLLTFLIIVYLIGRIKNRNKQNNDVTDTPTTKPKSDEIIDSLDWMLSMGIIDTNEYNRIMVKCLSYF